MEKNQKTLALNPEFLSLNLSLTEYRTYLFSLALTVGSVALPSALHHFYIAGQIFLPIYFFVLIGAYKLGWKVGVITAFFSVLTSFVLTGMPCANHIAVRYYKRCSFGISGKFFSLEEMENYQY